MRSWTARRSRRSQCRIGMRTVRMRTSRKNFLISRNGVALRPTEFAADGLYIAVAPGTAALPLSKEESHDVVGNSTLYQRCVPKLDLQVDPGRQGRGHVRQGRQLKQFNWVHGIDCPS